MATATKPRKRVKEKALAQPIESRIRELAVASEPLTVDEEKFIVHGVKILGERSINQPPDNNVYSKQVREKAIPLLEGARAHVDHWEDEPSYKDSFGVHRNVRESGTGLLSDVHCNPHHPITKQFLWDAKHNPRNVGFSLNTSATKHWTEDGMVVESINFSPVHHSVDLVHHGATTSSLHESAKQKGEPMKKTIREILVERKQPWQVAAFAKLREQADPYMGGDVAVADAAGEPASPDEQAKAAFRAMVMAVWDDEALDWAETIKKIKDIAAMQDKLMADTQAIADESPAEEPTPDSAAEKAKQDAAKAAQKIVETPKPDKSRMILNALIAESVMPDDFISGALAGFDTEADMRKAAKTYKERIKEHAGQAPVSGWRTPAAASDRPFPANVQEAARAWVRN